MKFIKVPILYTKIHVPDQMSEEEINTQRIIHGDDWMPPSDEPVVMDEDALGEAFFSVKTITEAGYISIRSIVNENGLVEEGECIFDLGTIANFQSFNVPMSPSNLTQYLSEKCK